MQQTERLKRGDLSTPRHRLMPTPRQRYPAEPSRCRWCRSRRRWARAAEGPLPISSFVPPAPVTDRVACAIRTLSKPDTVSAAENRISRDMVDYALGAATTLPEWTPRAAMPSSSGLLCWAKPAAGFTLHWESGVTDQMPSDAMAWYLRKDGTLQVLGACRVDRNEALRRQLGVDNPFMVGDGGRIDPDAPLRAQLIDERSVPLILVLGAAWLLMSQTTVATSRRIPPPQALKAGNSALRADASDRSAVSLIDLRRIAASPAEPAADGDRNRTYTHQWWVGGHWRQQACGPGRTYRKPVWIAPHIKGPEGTPLANERVHVWRR